MRGAGWLWLTAMALLGCSGEDSIEPTPTPAPEADLSPLGGDRPVEPIVPSDFDPTEPTPLVIFLHGYAASGMANDIVLNLDDEVEPRRFIYLRPDGTFDSFGRRFWNATDACCNFDGIELDDVSYIEGLIDEAEARFAVSTVSLVGHSNGGFMSHRFACDRASRIDAFASIAGMAWLDAEQCQPDAPVRALQIHGTEDDTILYDGDSGVMGLPPYPSAVETTAQWAMHNACTTSAMPVEARDYSDTTPGDETMVTRHEGCPDDGAAELWSMGSEGHLPNTNAAWRSALFDFLLD